MFDMSGNPRLAVLVCEGQVAIHSAEQAVAMRKAQQQNDCGAGSDE
jgi:hypothetical protein